MLINTQKLLNEFGNAKINDVAGCNSNGEVWTTDGTRIQDRADVAAIIAAHDPTEIAEPTIEERVAGLEAATLEILLGGG